MTHRTQEPALVWIDLEMTGLDPETDAILEIATIITDTQLNVIAEGPSITLGCPPTKLASMHAEVCAMHTKSGLTQRVQESTITVEYAAQETLTFLKEHCTAQTAPLCGNSVWQDKRFLQKYMPTIIEFLHYRIIDVSSVKQLVRYWYDPNIEKQLKGTIKKDTHRALDDIRESIEELKFYREHYFIQSP